MNGYSFTKLKLNGAYLIDIFQTKDSRGSFTKCFEQNIYFHAGIKFCVNESFVSVSKKNVIRGLHFQHNKPQAKLVCVLKGKLWDVIVDLRPNSNTYKQWVGEELSSDNHRALYIPKGCAHGFVSMEDDTIILYQCDGAYDRSTDTGIIYNDPEINITWPIDKESAILSNRDLQLMSLKEYEKQPMDIFLINYKEESYYDCNIMFIRSSFIINILKNIYKQKR